ncbi:hypothetical protein [Egicoccus halophilus]|uniref:Uncharacterized protein n=1 Tax=Egicoccus halophilus TaxID=1670830 RepID=A0A8J3ADD2_9ACTN|nr:hypothetical protein [Egicoccus halophilus]GGI05182.1 hypothetical protein GCM10011354_12820 [Egicoccus halophilus]
MRATGPARVGTPRLLFAVLLIAAPTQMLITRVLAEPYPALYQPSFASAPADGDVVVTTTPRVTVDYADGSVGHYDHVEVMAAAGVARIAVFDHAFRDDERAEAAQTRAWLRDRLAELGGGRTPTHAEIAWVRSEQGFGDPEPRPVAIDARRTYDFPS